MSASGYDARRLATAVSRHAIGELWRIIPSAFTNEPLGVGPGESRFRGRNAADRLVYPLRRSTLEGFDIALV